MALLYALGTSPLAHAQLTLNQGDSYAYEFGSLQFQGTGPFAQPRGALRIQLSTSAPRTGMLRMEIYETSLSDAPVFMRSHDVSGLPFFEDGGSLSTHLNLWSDRQGAVRLFMESGTATIDYFEVLRVAPSTVFDSVDFYWNTVIPVPEPSAIACAVVGALALGFWWRKEIRRKRA